MASSPTAALRGRIAKCGGKHHVPILPESLVHQCEITFLKGISLSR
jgi:hypothetical protein